MPRRNYYYSSGRDKSSAVVVTLNVIITVLLVIVLALLGLYAYTFFSGNNPLDRFGLKLPWESDIQSASSEPVVIIPSETVSETTAAAPATESSATVNIIVTEAASSETTAETEPKYTSTEYDKEFFANSLFIGDSIFTGFSGFGYLSPENVFAQVGLNPESALTKEIDGVTAVGKAEAMQPDRICIMLGTNGLAFLSADYMSSEMSKLIDSLREVCPNTEIVILSIPPVTEEHEKENPEKIPVIVDYNSKLEALAEEKECIFIDIFTMLQDENGYLAADYAEADGLHFLGKAYGVVLSRIQHELTYVEDGVTQSPAEETQTELSDIDAIANVSVTEAQTTEAEVTETVAVVVPSIDTSADTSVVQQ